MIEINTNKKRIGRQMQVMHFNSFLSSFLDIKSQVVNQKNILAKTELYVQTYYLLLKLIPTMQGKVKQ